MMGQTPQANASLDHQTRLAAGQACLEAALNEYLPRGLSIICCCDPDHIGVGRDHGKTCDSPGKMPLCKWAEFQTRLPTIAEVRQLWKDFPYGNVGCVLGQVSGMVRVDVDGPSGEAKLQQWSKGDLPPTWEFTSSAESRGLLYAWPRALPCKTTSQRMKGDHEELRLMGNGSQTVLPPSRHPSGSLYAWKPSHNPHDIPLAPAPDWLLERLRDDSSRQGNTTTHLSGEIPAVDMEALGLDEGTVAFLHDGTWPSPSRSEPSFSVLKRLIHAGLDDASIAALLMDPANKAGEKARERGLRWLAGEIGRGRAAVGKDLRRYADAGMTAEQVALVLWPYSTPPPSSKAWLHLAWTRTVPDMTGNTPAADAHQRRNGSSNVTSEDIANSWPPLQALPSLLPDVPVLPSLMLPPGLRPWMEDIAERMQVPLEYVAIPGMVAAGALIGRQISIHPKQKDDWFCVPNLWGAIVGRSGLMKSPTLEQALKPLDRLAAQAMDAYKAREERNTTMQEALDAQIAGVKEGLKKAAKENNAALCASVGARLAALQAEREDLIATLRRFKTNDATIQKLGELLRDNPHGMLFFRDELSGWLSSLNQDGREGDREFFLETWNGDGTYTFDRIGRGMIHVDGLCLSIIGGIQPGKLARYVYEACEGGAGDDGLLQRFQLLVWPVHNQAFMNIDRLPKAQERQRAYALYERLADLDTTGLGATTTEFQTIPALRFTPEAQELFDAWRLELETRLRSDTIHSPAFESHLAKYRSLMPSLALIFHLLRKVEGDWEGNAVALDVTRLAAEWCEFLEAHARKVYAGVLQKDLQAAHALVDKIRTGALTDGQAPREVYRNGWSLLQTPDDVYGGLTYLERHGWIRVCEEPSGPKGGRPREVIHLHPSLHAEPPT